MDQVITGDVPDQLLLSIQPETIVEWFQLKAYGKSRITENDRPTEC